MKASSHDSSKGAGCTVAVLTPRGEGGISVVQVAGPRAAAVLAPLFRHPRGGSLDALAAGGLLYGVLRREGEVLDEVLVCRRGNDTYEVNCHGGIVATQRVIAALQAAGAVLAATPPLDADLDALQAEAQRRLPAALTDAAARMLLRQLEGAPSRRLRRLADQIESDGAVDATAELTRVQAGARRGKALCVPPRLVVAGRPNVGKSTLVNALLAEERVLVHDRPGTTRDAVETLATIGDAPFLLVDTAGLRESADAVEMIGIDRGRAQLRQSDLLLLVFDVSEPLTPEDEALLASDAIADRKRLAVLNKADLPHRFPPERIAATLATTPLLVSARTGAGMEALERRIVAEALPAVDDEEMTMALSDRQEVRLASAHAEAAAAATDDDRPARLRRAATLLRACLRRDDGDPLHSPAATS